MAVSGKGPDMVLTGINQQDLSCKTCSKLTRETYTISVFPLSEYLFKVNNNDTGTIFRPLFYSLYHCLDFLRCFLKFSY